MMAHWPQIAFLAASAIVFATHCAKAGQHREAFDPVRCAFGLMIEFAILYAGGFFAPIGWGQP